jgi:hypothetical protein
MLGIQQVKAPGIAWVGQLFALWGRADFGLMLFVLLTQALTLSLVYRSVRRPLVASCAVVSLAASPLFVALSHEFYVEPLQTLAVAWFILIMTRSPGWSRERIAGNLMGAAALAMAAKISSPLYCMVPGLIAVRRAWAAGPGRARLALWGGAFMLLLTAAWYLRNGAGTLAFARMSFSDGTPASWWERLRYWLTVARLGAAPYLQAGLVGAALVSALRRGAPVGQPGFYALAAVLLVFSFSANPCARYLLPAVAFVPLLLAWALEELDRTWLTQAALACFLLQLGVVHAQALGLLPLPASADVVFFRQADWNPRGREELDAVVDATCREGAVSMFGVSRLRMNPTSAAYAALKRGKRGCRYYEASESNLEAAESVIFTDPVIYPAPAWEQAMNRNASGLLSRMEKDPRFRMERVGPGGRILLFKRRL